MPLIAVALALSTLLHAGFAAFASLSSTPSAPTVTVVFEPDAVQGPSSDPRTRWVAPHSETSLWSGSGSQAGPIQSAGAVAAGRVPRAPHRRHRAAHPCWLRAAPWRGAASFPGAARWSVGLVLLGAQAPLPGPPPGLTSWSASAFISRGTQLMRMLLKRALRLLATSCSSRRCACLTAETPFTWSTTSSESM